MVGQFLVPLACVIAARVSITGRRRRGALVTAVAQSHAPDALHEMSWREFGHLVGEGFRLQGYQVLESGGAGPDGSVDPVLSRRGEKYLVQCKQWKAFKVGVEIVRELYGVMAARGVAGGFVVTSGSFTAEATAFAAGRNVQLVDGTKLFAMLQQARAAQKDTRASQRPAQQPATPVPPVQRKAATPFGSAKGAATGTAATATSPSCPLCASAMVSRTARKGVNAGSAFWRCSALPCVQRNVGSRRLKPQTAKSSIFLPAANAALSHLGCRPRPLQASPVAVFRYFAATFVFVGVAFLERVLPWPELRAPRSARVKPVSAISALILSMASVRPLVIVSSICRSRASHRATDGKAAGVFGDEPRLKRAFGRPQGAYSRLSRSASKNFFGGALIKAGMLSAR